MSSSVYDTPLQVFHPQRRVGIFVSYGLLALAGTVVIAFVANHAYQGAVGRLDPEADHSAAFAFLVIGLGLWFFPATVLLRWRHIYAAVYRDRLVMSNGFTVTTLTFAELQRVVRTDDSDGADKIVFEYHRRNRTGSRALHLLSVSQQDALMALVNGLVAERRTPHASQPPAIATE